MKGASSPGAASLASILLLATTAPSTLLLALPPCGAFSPSRPRVGGGRTPSPARRGVTGVTPPCAASAGVRWRARGASGTLSASLRDLAGGSDDNSGGETGGGGRGAGTNQSRSRYGSDTGFRTRDPFGTGTEGSRGANFRRGRGGGGGGGSEEEGGLNPDRVSSFSFATSGLRSGSQGTLSGAEDLDEMGAGEGAAPPSGAAGREEGGDGEKEASESADAESAAGKDGDKAEAGSGSPGPGGGFGMAADDLHGNVSINYSRRKYPEPLPLTNTDEADEGGLHTDRLGTFSFSNDGPSPRAPAASRPGPVPDRRPTSDASRDGPRDDSEEFGVDNFRNSVEVYGSRSPSPLSSRRPPPRPDEGQSDQSARLSTFSFARDERDARDPPSQPRGSGSGSGSGLRGLLADDEGNHDDRLGTFSFAGSDPSSGSTSGAGTSASSPLPEAGRSSVTTPRRQDKRDRSEAESSMPSPGGRGSFDPHAIYTASSGGRGGGLSGLASGVETVSRVDRIKEMREKTDPRRLHPGESPLWTPQPFV